MQRNRAQLVFERRVTRSQQQQQQQRTSVLANVHQPLPWAGRAKFTLHYIVATAATVPDDTSLLALAVGARGERRRSEIFALEGQR